MEFLIILVCIVIYIFFAILFVNFVKNRTDIKIYKWLAVIFVILLPTWDVVLGYLVYYPACMLVPKTVIYETAETDGIYYEGINDYYFKLDNGGRQISDEELTSIGSIDQVFKIGYTFAESQVTREHISWKVYRKIEPVIYRCIPLPKDESRPSFQRTSCSVVKDIKSNYMVKVTIIKAGISELDFKNIYNRATGKLMAEYKQVVIWPFFHFLIGCIGARQAAPV